jgi:hypothetical protein
LIRNEGKNRSDHPLYLVNGTAMVILFFVFRIVTGLWLLYATIYLVHLAPEENSCREFTAKMGGVGYALGPLVCLFYALWCYWFSLIMEGIKAAFGGTTFENDPDSDAEEGKEDVSSLHKQSAVACDLRSVAHVICRCTSNLIRCLGFRA